MIRQMKIEDCIQVAAIDQACILNPWTANDFEKALSRPEQHYQVAVIEGRIAGFAGMMAAADEADITHIAVLQEYRRQQAATLLLQALIQQAQTIGVKTIYLEVRQQNRSAQAFYQAMNFEQIGIRKNYYTNPAEDAIIMKKEI